MNRNVAIVLTIITALVCGLPSIISMCLGALALVGTQMPEVLAQTPGSTPEEITVGAAIFLCVGAVLLLVPILVGIFAFKYSKKEDDVNDSIDYIPPVS